VHDGMHNVDCAKHKAGSDWREDEGPLPHVFTKSLNGAQPAASAASYECARRGDLESTQQVEAGQ